MPKTSISLGGRELDVAQATVGFLEDEWWPWTDRMIKAAAEVEDVVRSAAAQADAGAVAYTEIERAAVRKASEVWADGFHLLLRGNEGVTAEWIRRALPVSRDGVRELYHELTVKAGITDAGTRGGAEGEAQRP